VRLRELGEFGLIARIERMARRVSGAAVALGIGDDAALLRLRPGEQLALTTDAFVEGVHFRFRDEPALRIGRRALTANLSDLAAMGARPLGFTLALAAPASLEVRAALALVRGALREGAAHGCPLVGGNVTGARETSLTIAALGGVRAGGALLRSGARPGDRLLVTGCLGAAALDRLRAERRGGRLRHRPQARVAAGLALGSLRGAGACIDVSDGLLSDLRHLLEASRVGAELDVAALPRPRGFAAACRPLRLDPDRLALTGGEDYELLFTVRAAAPAAPVLSRRLGVPVAEIGRITTRRGGLRLLGAPSGSLRLPGGWRHFGVR
jgi:thiamine-monophosphate kinase